MVKKISESKPHDVIPNEIAMDEERNGCDAKANELENTDQNRDQFFGEGLRIIMYDKIIKSGFNHLSIFLDDFNYIYNEVITSTNNNLGDAQYAGDGMDLQAG